MNKYRVSGGRPVLGNEPGSEFEHDFDEADERVLLDSGRLEIVPRAYQNIGPRVVHGAAPGGVFEAALRVGEERALLEAGHIEIVGDAESLADKPRKELDELAREAGVSDPEKLPNRQAVVDAIAAASNAQEA
jgi:hypothetical protein